MAERPGFSGGVSIFGHSHHRHLHVRDTSTTFRDMSRRPLLRHHHLPGEIQSPRYDLPFVGHSFGTIITYDLLTKAVD